MEQIKSNYFGGANFEARTVKDIIEPAKSIPNNVSVRAALDQMQAQATDSSPVIDQCGELLGILSKNKMNRNVGGFGHDPKTEPVEAHIEKNNAYCFEDQTIAEAEQMMLNAKLGEVFVVTREKLLVGTINIEAIAQEGGRVSKGVLPKSQVILTPRRRSGTAPFEVRLNPSIIPSGVEESLILRITSSKRCLGCAQHDKEPIWATRLNI